MNTTTIEPSNDGRWAVIRRADGELTYYAIFSSETAALHAFLHIAATQCNAFADLASLAKGRVER